MGNEEGDSSGDELVEVDALEESDDDFAYEEIDIDEDDPLLLAEEDDFDSRLGRWRVGGAGRRQGHRPAGRRSGRGCQEAGGESPEPPDPFRRHSGSSKAPRESPVKHPPDCALLSRSQVMDDFVRNFWSRWA